MNNDYEFEKEEDIQAAERDFMKYDEQPISDPKVKSMLNSLLAISKALAEISDELKGKEEDAPKLKWTERPWGLLCSNCGHPALNYPNGKDAHSPYCPWCGSEMEVDNDGNT